MGEPEFVERPEFLHRGVKDFYDYKAILATATNGKAVVVKPRTTVDAAKETLRVSLFKKGFKLFAAIDPQDRLVVWCEKLDRSGPDLKPR